MKIIMWARNGNIYYRKTKDGQNEIRAAFKARNHVAITVRNGEKHLHRELYLRYGRAPHVGVLSEAIKLWENLADAPDDPPAK